MSKRISILIAASSTMVLAETPLPSPHLLANTKVIHEKIVAKPDLTVEEMKPYADAVERAENAKVEMLPIPGGSFVMGSPDSEEGRKPDEGPQRKVEIEPFWMAKFEITWDLYRPFMENGTMRRNKDGTLDRDSDIYNSEPPEIKEGETFIDTLTQPTSPHLPMHFGMSEGYLKEYPAVGLTQHAANQFCQWLSAQTGHFYRLPTEAEWEYACRAGTATAFHFGDDVSKLGEYAWFAENSEFKYQKVGTKKPNPWGLYDMHGNVAEHVLDQYVPEAYATMKEGAVSPWVPAPNRYPTAVRGGHWDNDPAALRSSARLGSDPAWKVLDPDIPKSIWYFTNCPWLGFRIVRPLKTPSLEEMHRYWNLGPGPTE
jgi:formylglycine-generating enzyme required for sulfatase activity